MASTSPTSLPSPPFISTCDPPAELHSVEITKGDGDVPVAAFPTHVFTKDPHNADLRARPVPVHHLTAPAYQSPMRHHKRQASEHRVVKETLNAESRYKNNETDGRAEHHINQYIIRDEIGRGSFGAVHLAEDQYGQQYAVKEFSKSRLRKRAQSSMLRRPRHERRGVGFNSPLHRHSINDVHNEEEKNNPLYLIKEEIAIMKKLNHPNLVSLIEVLDDPEEDSLYMVLEMCKKGVVMKVGLGDVADPYESERCRHWFRDLILGIEYLHAQGVVHRDIKPDNLLLTEDDVLKIVDFGVSEMFEKENVAMTTAKSAGSPAFLPPELCITKHGDISGKAADIWSMGVSLYCLRYGRIPFERTGVLELYEAIRTEELSIDESHEPEFCDLMRRLLEKDPKKRITMDQIRIHPWVTKDGKDPLLSSEENCSDLVEAPSELEVNHAITAKMKHLITLMKAVRKFKGLVEKKRPLGIQEALNRGKRHFRSPLDQTDGPPPPPLFQSKSDDTYDRRSVEEVLAGEGIQSRTLNPFQNPLVASPEEEYPPDLAGKYTPSPPNSEPKEGERGHAQDPLSETPLFLGIGAGVGVSAELGEEVEEAGVAESPTAADFSIYDTAYAEEVERIREAQGREATVYLNRRVETKFKENGDMASVPAGDDVALGGLRAVIEKAREKKNAEKEKAKEEEAAKSEGISGDRMEGIQEESSQPQHKVKQPEDIPNPKTDPTHQATHPTTIQQENNPTPAAAIDIDIPQNKEIRQEIEQETEIEKEKEVEKERKREKGMRMFNEVAAKAVANTKALGGALGERGGGRVDRVMKMVGRSERGEKGGERSEKSDKI